MPNEYVDGNSADEKSVTDQHDPSTTQGDADPFGAIGGAVDLGEFIITETEKITDDLGNQRFKREYRRAGSDKLVKVERLFRGSVVGISFGPGATDDDLVINRLDSNNVRMAKFLELDRRKSPEQKAEEDEERDARVEAELKKHDEAQRMQHEEKEAVAAEARKERDIVKRAKNLEMGIQFKDVKKVRIGDMVIPQPQMTDTNKMVVLDALFDGEQNKPHRDHFRGRIVDHEGRVIDDHYPVAKWIEAFRVIGLSGVSTKAAREILREWSLLHERNDLIDHVKSKIPIHDGQSRMRTKLINLFECSDTPLNRDFSQYFFLSLYARVMRPGSEAPMVLSLFGAQGCGKSRFSKLICQTLISNAIAGGEESDSVQLNLDGDRLDFLRNITGRSIIASVGEMTGFTRGDLNKIKDFITRASDQLHYKFEGTFTQSRQWITVMDGNKYEGLQRDESGNRRFYPMFCGQLPDEMGKPQWKMDFSADFTGFADDLWQIMAEAAEWFDENGEDGYMAFVNNVSKQVIAFSADQVSKESGVVEDDLVSPYIDEALIKCAMYQTNKSIWIDRKDIVSALIGVSGRMNLEEARGFNASLLKAMKARGSDGKSARNVKIDGRKTTVTSYIFKGFDDSAALYAFWENRLGVDASDEAVLTGYRAEILAQTESAESVKGTTVADIARERKRRTAGGEF